MAKKAKKAAKKSGTSKPAKAKKGKKTSMKLGDPEVTTALISKENEELQKEMTSFVQSENKSAGRRARKHLQAIARACKQARKEIQETINKMKGKK